MNRTNNEKFIIFLVTLACIGLSVESILLGWEFWVSPLIIIGGILIWFIHITGRPEYRGRKIVYLIYAMLLTFYHGVHASSYYDIAIVSVFVMVGFSFLDQQYMMNMLLSEYYVLFFIQLYLNRNSEFLGFDVVNVSRVVLYLIIVNMVYLCCVKAIYDRAERRLSEAEKDERIEAVDADMEDFLSNISMNLEHLSMSCLECLRFRSKRIWEKKHIL